MTRKSLHSSGKALNLPEIRGCFSNLNVRYFVRFFFPVTSKKGMPAANVLTALRTTDTWLSLGIFSDPANVYFGEFRVLLVCFIVNSTVTCSKART